MALRTEHDPLQVIWKNAAPAGKSTEGSEELLRAAIHDYLVERGEPASYLHIHTAGLIALAEAGALKNPEIEFDESLRKTNSLFEFALKGDGRFVHYSTGENVDTGMWGLNLGDGESLSDRVEVAIVTFLQKNPNALYLEIEADMYPHFPGLLTPSKGLIYAILKSYAEKETGHLKLRAEDVASVRRHELNKMYALIEAIGRRLGYVTHRQDKFLQWEENGITARTFLVLASALLNRALRNSEPNTIIVIPGGRAALAAYKQERDPSLTAQLKKHRLVKYRLLRKLLDLRVLTLRSSR